MPLYARPAAAPVALRQTPALESWNATAHPDQMRLRAFLDEVVPVVGVDDGPVAVELVVGLAADIPLDRGGRDLDNYLLPIVRGVGAARVAAAFGVKRHGGSTISASVAMPLAADAGPPMLRVRTTGSSESLAWKQQIRDACARVVAAPQPAGPVALRVHFAVARRRNWAALWKPAIDALGPVLGVGDPAMPFRPDDDRVVELELHRTIDDGLGDAVQIEYWWCPADR